jgi:hypothetical protein
MAIKSNKSAEAAKPPMRSRDHALFFRSGIHFFNPYEVDECDRHRASGTVNGVGSQCCAWHDDVSLLRTKSLRN